MPIYCLEGTPGSGKTLYCVQKIIPDFLKIRDSAGNLVPRHIYTNIEGLRPELICAFMGIPYEAIAEYFHVLGQVVDEQGRVHEDKDYIRWWFFKPESIEWIETQNSNRQVERMPDLEKAQQIELGSLVIIDEVQNYYSNRDFATQYSKCCVDYITKNRHFGWTLWWMSQSVESVDVTFRRNTQYVYFLERKEIYGSSTTSSVKMYEGWLAGNKTNMPPFATSTFRFDKKFFGCYNSYVQGVTEEKRYKKNVFLQSKLFIVMAVLFVVCVVMAIVNNPLTATKKTAAMKNIQPSAKAATPKPVSFSGASGAAAEGLSEDDEDSTDEKRPCMVNYFIQDGKSFVVLPNGKTRKVKAGEVYEQCE